MDEFLNIDTPENVIFGYELAGIGSRFLAAMVDTILIVSLQIVAYGFLLLIIGATGTDNAVLEWGVAIIIALSTFIAFGFLWGFYIFFEMLWNGQSPGKRLAGLRVIRRDGTPITLTESAIRNLVRIIDFLPAYYGIGVVTMFFDGQARRLGDMAAGTLVVFDRTGVTLDNLREATQRPAGSRIIPFAVAQLPISRLDQDDIQMAESFLARQRELPNADSLSQRIMQKLYRQMELESPRLSASSRLRHISDLVHLARYPDAEIEQQPMFIPTDQSLSARPQSVIKDPFPATLPVHDLASSDLLKAADFLRDGQFAEQSKEAAGHLAYQLLTKMDLDVTAYHLPPAQVVLQQIVTTGREQGLL